MAENDRAGDALATGIDLLDRDPRGAWQWVRRALVLDPGGARALVVAIHAAQRLGLAGRTARFLSRARLAAPDQVATWLLASRMAEGPADALAALRRARLVGPDDVRPAIAATEVALQAGHPSAVDWGLRAVRLGRVAPALVHNLAVLSRGRPEAAALARLAVCGAPDEAESWLLLAAVLAGEPAAAGRAQRCAALVAPERPEPWLGLGYGALVLGDGENACRAYRRAAVHPAHVQAGLVGLHYSITTDGEAIARAHRAWGRDRIVAPKPLRHGRGTPLRVGFLSSGLRRHATGYFLPPLLAHRRGWRAQLYSVGLHQDEITARLRQLADGFTDLSRIADAEAAGRIAMEGVDVLVDLDGHVAGSRIGILERRPTERLVTWLGLDYVGGTGLGHLDGALTDRHHVAPGEEGRFVEPIRRFPHGSYPFEAPAEAPPVTPSPRATSGRVTFGSFNALFKLAPPVLAAWGRLLAGLPDARLLVSAGALDYGPARARILAGLTAAGARPDQIHLAGSGSRREILNRYGQVDIALDSMPYSGGMVTLEALWQGVPVVTFPGDRLAGRHATSHLRTAGLDDLVAGDLPGAMALARTLAGQPDRLADLRAGLRDRLRAAPMMDGPGFAAAFADLVTF